MTFPVFLDETRYKSKRRQMIGGLPTEAQAVIDELQPRGTSHPLWVLHRLWNEAKHRLITVVGAGVGEMEYDASGFSFLGRLRLVAKPGPFRDGEVIGWVELPTGGTPEQHTRPRILIDLAFPRDSPAQGAPLVAQLQQLQAASAGVIERLAPFFP